MPGSSRAPLSTLTQPGDAYPITIGREPIALVRDHDGSIRRGLEHLAGTGAARS